MIVDSYLNDLKAYVETADYAGYDPYDALSSPLIRLISSKSKNLRIVFTQFLRRCPVNLRPLLGIKKGHNPKDIPSCMLLRKSGDIWRESIISSTSWSGFGVKGIRVTAGATTSTGSRGRSCGRRGRRLL